MSEKSQSVDWEALRLDCRTALGRQRWIRAIRCSMSDDQFIAWKAVFDQRYPRVDPATDESRLQPLRGPALPMCVRNTYSGQIEVLEKFVAPAPITMEQVRQVRRFTGTESDDDPDETIEQVNRMRAYVAFKCWHHRVQLAAADIRAKEKPPKRARRAKT